MLFRRMVIIISNPNCTKPLGLSGRRINVCIRLKQKWDLECLSRPSHTVTVSVYQHWLERFQNWKQFEPSPVFWKKKKKTRVNTEYERENGSNLSFSFTSLPSHAVDENRLTNISSAVLFIFGKWCHIWCLDWFKLSVNGRFTDCLHFPALLLQNFPLCP